MIPTDKPLVVNGAWLYALGKITDDAKFTCSVYSLTEDGEFDRLMASKTITGKDVLTVDTYVTLFYYTLPFEFDEPIVLDQEGTEGGMYAIMVTGFHDGGIEYLAPLMQKKPNRFENCFGFYQIEFMYKGEHNVGLSFVAYHENEYGEMFSSFAINLDAHYPWLETDETEIDLDKGEATINLKSYYAANDLNISLDNGKELPKWLNVAKTGRYDNTILKFSATSTTEAINDNITVSAPGVQKKLHIKKSAGVDNILAPADKQPKETYDLMGRSVDMNSRVPGFYIIKNADGSTTKQIR